MSKIQGRRPQFMLAGAPKCGTTSLADELSEHPAIDLGKIKEPNSLMGFGLWKRFENQNVARFNGDISDTHTIIQSIWDRHWSDADKDAVIGEATPGYIWHRQAAVRMASLLPDIRLIFILRHPTERLWSSYRHHLGMRRITGVFEKSLQRGFMSHVMRRHYLNSLQMYYERFDDDQILVIPFEQWRVERDTVHRQILAHIGVDYQGTLTSRHSNKSSARYKNAGARRVANIFAINQPSTDTPWDTWMSTSMGIAARAFRGVSKMKTPGRTPLKARLSDDTRRSLDAYYAAHERGLSSLTGVDFKSWWGLQV